MSWSTIRTATEEDCQRLEKSATRFAARHEIEILESETAVQAVTGHIDYFLGNGNQSEIDNARRLRKLWLACTKRALKNKAAEGIAYGYVGYEAP